MKTQTKTRAAIATVITLPILIVTSGFAAAEESGDTIDAQVSAAEDVAAVMEKAATEPGTAMADGSVLWSEGDATYEVALDGDSVLHELPQKSGLGGMVSAAASCATSTTYRSATGTTKSAGITVFKNHLTAKIRHNCNGIVGISVEDTTQQAVAPGISEVNVTGKTALKNGRYARAKAAYHYKAGVGWFTSSWTACLAINATRSAVALGITVDTKCHASPAG